MIPPEPEPEPPTPTVDTYSFVLTNSVTNSIKFGLIFYDQYSETVGSVFATTSLLGQGQSGSMSFDADDIPTGAIKVQVRYSTNSSTPSSVVTWGSNSIRYFSLQDLKNKTFKGTYGGTPATNTWVIE